MFRPTNTTAAETNNQKKNYDEIIHSPYWRERERESELVSEEIKKKTVMIFFLLSWIT